MCCLLLSAVLASANVVFLTVDTLRADHLGCYGYAYATSPHIDNLAEQALVYDDCVCEAPLTFPSFGSMLTSLYPRMTGTTRNGLRMPESVPTVAEQFRQAGYQTFCVQSNWTLKADLSGLDRGFDTYDDGFHDKRWGMIKPERYADEVTDVALELLTTQNPKGPLFCWIHYSDPHETYRFHKDFAPLGDPKRTDKRERRIAAKYDSEVAYCDHHIGRLLAALPQDNTFILFVADHGESLYEHDYLGHGRRIYQPGVRIPLMIKGPGIEPGRTDVPTRAIDVGPTLLGLVGLEPAKGMLGTDLRHNAPSYDRARVIETYGGAVPRLPGARAMMAHRPPQRQGVLLNGWKLILNGEKAELFYLLNDPLERKDLVNDHPDRVVNLKNLVLQWDKETARGRFNEANLTEDDIEALKALGYLE